MVAAPLEHLVRGPADRLVRGATALVAFPVELHDTLAPVEDGEAASWLTKSDLMTKMLGMKTVSVHEAKTYLSRLLDRAHAGEEVIIAKRGTPYARLCPLEPPPARRPGLLSGTVDESFFEPLPDEELEAWER